MTQKMIQYKQITKFLSSFSILQHTDGATVISSQNHTYLIRNIQISNSINLHNNEELNQIINTLSQHQTFNSKNILSLIDFELIFNKNKTQSQIRAVYEYGQKSLVREIQQRKQSQEHFDQQALWGLLYSITSPLRYLQQKNIIYGVIDCSRVFLDNNVIAILDPSSTGIDPYQITSNRLYSPQLLQQQRCIQEIDMFKSDVYVLGLLMLQCALLKMNIYQYDQNVIKICLTQIKDIYSQNFCQLIQSMVNPEVQQRPSFDQVLKTISSIFEISTSQNQTLRPMMPDIQNEPNQYCKLDQDNQKQNIDILETQYIRYNEYQNPSIQDYSRARNRFYTSRDSRLTESPIQQGSQYSQTSSLFIQQSIVKSFQRSRRIYKPKQIKDKLVKQDFVYHSDRDNLQSHQMNFHRRSQTQWQKQWPQFDGKNVYETKRMKSNSINTQNKSKQTFKQNNPIHNNCEYAKHYQPLNKQNLFTKPEIMNMIKNDIKNIQERKKKGLNIHFSYLSNQQNKNHVKYANNENQQNINSIQLKNNPMVGKIHSDRRPM